MAEIVPLNYTKKSTKAKPIANISFEGITLVEAESKSSGHASVASVSDIAANSHGNYSIGLTKFQLTSAKYKLLLCVKLSDKTNIANPYLKKFMDSLLTSLRYTDLLIIDFLDTSSCDVIIKRLKYHDKTALFLKRGTQPQSPQDTISKGVTYFRSINDQFLHIGLPKGVYGCNIVFFTDKDNLANENGFPSVIIEMPNSKPETSNRSSAKHQYITFNNACDSKQLSRRIFRAVTVHNTSLMKDGNPDCFLLCNVLNLSYAVMNKPVDFQKKKDSFIDVMCSAILDYNVSLLADLHELNLGREIFIQHLCTAIQRLRDQSQSGPIESDRVMEKLRKCTSTIELDLKVSDAISNQNEGMLILFLSSLLSQELEASLFYWTMLDNLIANALVAHHLLTKMEEKERNADKLKKIGKYKDKYQNASTEVLKNCYIESSQSTKHVLVEKIPYWNNKSSMSVARTTENEVFLNQEACRELNEHLWSSYNGNGKQFYKKYSNSTWSLTSPRVRFLLDLIGYMLFMMVYSVLLVSQLNQANINVLEFVVIVYTLILFIREFDQWCYQEEKPKNVPKTQIKQKKSSFLSKEYLLDPFNMLDNLSLVVAAIGWSLRWLAFYNPDNEGLMEGTRYLLSFNFAIYSIRFLEFFYTSQSLGPILVFIVNMLSIFIRYILIICVFLVSFSVASESLLHQEKTLNVDSFNEVFCIFKRGFWSTIGEYFLDEIHPSDANDFATKARKYVVLGLLGFYALFIQILLFNLVISLFGEEIENRRSKWDAISNFLRLKQIMQYSTIRFLLPPFLPLTIFLFFRSKDPYSIDLGKEASDLRYFETYAANKHTIFIIESNLLRDKTSKRRKVRNPTPGNETAVPNQSDKTAVCQMPGSRNTLNVEPVQRRNAQPNRQLGPAELNWQQLFNENIKQIALRMREIVCDQSDSDNDDYNDNVEYNNCYFDSRVQNEYFYNSMHNHGPH